MGAKGQMGAKGEQWCPNFSEMDRNENQEVNEFSGYGVIGGLWQ